MSYYKRRDSYSGFGAGSYITRTIKALVIINVTVFLFVHIFRAFPWLLVFGMVPRLVLSKFMIWQLATYMFVHADLWHLAVNMLMLWFFGPAIESAWGRKQFLFYYFFTGIGAGLCSLIFSFNSYAPIIGASGAIFGILAAYAVMFPEHIILLFFVFPMKMKHAVLVLAGMNLLGAISSSGSGIAYFAHLGGALFGYIYLKSEWFKMTISRLNWDYLKLWKTKRDVQRKELDQKNLNQAADAILDKISKYGMDSLTSRERKILELRSKSR